MIVARCAARRSGPAAGPPRRPGPRGTGRRTAATATSAAGRGPARRRRAAARPPATSTPSSAGDGSRPARPPSAAPAAPASAMPSTANGTAVVGHAPARRRGPGSTPRRRPGRRPARRRARRPAAPGVRSASPDARRAGWPQSVVVRGPRRLGEAQRERGRGQAGQRRSPSRRARSRRRRRARLAATAVGTCTSSSAAVIAPLTRAKRVPGADRGQPVVDQRLGRAGAQRAGDAPDDEAEREGPERRRRRPERRRRPPAARRRGPATPRRDHRSASAPAGTSVSSAGHRPDGEQHGDLRARQAGVEEEQRVERVVRAPARTARPSPPPGGRAAGQRAAVRSDAGRQRNGMPRTVAGITRARTGLQRSVDQRRRTDRAPPGGAGEESPWS